MKHEAVDADGAPAESGASGPPLKLIAFLVVATATAVFIIRNRSERVPVDFLLWDSNARVWTTLAFAVLLGILLDRLFASWWRRARNRSQR